MKKYLLGILTGIILTSSVAGVLAYTISAKDVLFTPSDNTWQVSNVEGAINSLKEGFKPVFGNDISNYSMGDILTNRQTSITLQKGKYILLATRNLGTAFAERKEQTGNMTINVNCANCTLTKLSGKYYQISATVTNHTAYNTAINQYTQYYAEITQNNEVLTAEWTQENDNNYIAQNITLTAVPIG